MEAKVIQGRQLACRLTPAFALALGGANASSGYYELQLEAQGEVSSPEMRFASSALRFLSIPYFMLVLFVLCMFSFLCRV